MSDEQLRRNALSPIKRALLDKWLRGGANVIAADVIPRRRQASQPPLSFAQQRLWLGCQLDSHAATYNISSAVHLKGVLDVSALHLSLNEIVRRHEVLRATFAVMDGNPVQAIAPSPHLPLPVVDLTRVSPTEQPTAIEHLATAEARRPFDLAHGPLLRATLLRLSPAEHVGLLTMHHIISDGWSIGVLRREMALIYEALIAGKPSPLADLPIQYADFAVWQRERLQHEALETQLAYWRRQLGENPPVLDFPTDRPRPATKTFRGARQPFALGPALSEALRLLSQREGVTVFMTLLAAFNVLLHWYTQQEDIVVGTDVANRNRAELEGMIGFFANQLVLRTDLSGDPSFQELLRRVQHVTLSAYAHQDVPFERLVEALNPRRDLSRTPLFQAKLVLQAPWPRLELAQLTLSTIAMEVDTGTAKFDLLLNMWEDDGQLAGWLEYSTDLFEADTIRRATEHFQTLLRRLVDQPGARLSDLHKALAEADRVRKVAQQQEFMRTRQSRLKNVRPKPAGEIPLKGESLP